MVNVMWVISRGGTRGKSWSKSSKCLLAMLRPACFFRLRARLAEDGEQRRAGPRGGGATPPHDVEATARPARSYRSEA